MKTLKRFILLSIFMFTLMLGNLTYAADPRIYLAVFYYGQISLVADFSNEKVGLMAILDEMGKWDMQIKDPENADIEYHKEGKLKGKIAKIGNIKIERYAYEQFVDKSLKMLAQPSKIGNVVIKYYNSSENKAAYLKVMRVGNLTLGYHAYQTQPSYGKISHVDTISKKRIRVDYHRKDIKGVPLTGKLQSIGSIKCVYNNEGEIISLEGQENGIEIEFWGKDKLKKLEQETKKDDELEKKLEKELEG